MARTAWGGRLLAIVAEHRRIFLSAGLVAIALQVLHQGRQVFLPLWGDAIGLGVAQIGLIIGVSSFVDAACFYPAGWIMDRWGRKWSCVPSLLTLSLAFLVLPATSEVSGYALVAMLTGLGHGLGAGLVTSLGADFAPPGRRGELLGVWRLIGDAGSAGGPFLVSLVTALASLGLASICTAGLGLAGAAVMWLFVPETLQQRPGPTPGRSAHSAPGLLAPEPAKTPDRSE